MKKGFIILFAAMLCMMTSCTEKFGYKHLDGMWQVQSMTRDGVTEHPEGMYFSFQMNIMEVKQLGVAQFAGSFQYTEDVIHSKFPGISVEQAHIFGMKDAEQEFVVEKLNSDKLILQSDYARVELRKY